MESLTQLLRTEQFYQKKRRAFKHTIKGLECPVIFEEGIVDVAAVYELRSLSDGCLYSCPLFFKGCGHRNVSLGGRALSRCHGNAAGFEFIGPERSA